MEKLIDIVNQLQNIYAESGCEHIDLPQIAVVGAQSSGKSSVLEHIVGKSFLPRGSDVVTRCPLILQMEHSESTDEYAVFNNNEEKRYTDYKQIKNKIEAETDKIAGVNKGISNTPITLKMTSPSFTSLTLIDLPGIVRVPTGDQPIDIEEKVRNLILDYIKKPNCLILAVTPANMDLATSDSIKIAAEVDPECKRTLLVLTKLDLMDEGTDACNMLSGKIIPMNLGIIGVVNRSQKNINEDKSIEESRKDEENFFKTRYKSIADKNGSAFLTKTVQHLLISHIKDVLPYLKRQISDKLANALIELNQYEEKDTDKKSILLDLLANFSRAYVSAIKGNLKDIETEELHGGAIINYVFKNFSTTVNSIAALEGLTEKHMLIAMKNASGITPEIFVPEVAFELIVKKQIEKFRNPSLICVDLVFKQMHNIVNECLEDKSLRLERYSHLKLSINNTMSSILKNRISVSKIMVEDFINIQLAYINTNQQIFSNQQNLPLMASGNSENQAWNNDKDRVDINVIQNLIKNYFEIEKKLVQDTIPKIIMYRMVNHVMERLETLLISSLGDQAEELLIESQSTVDKIKALKVQVEGLERVQRQLNILSSSTV